MSLLSLSTLIAAVLVRYIPITISLSLLSSLELSFVESVIKFNREFDYFIKLIRSVNSYKFILNIFFKSLLKELDIDIIIEVEVRDNLLEFGGVYAS